MQLPDAGDHPGGEYGFLGISIVAFIVLGSMLEGIPAMVLFGPLLFPVARTLGGTMPWWSPWRWGLGLFAPSLGRVSPDAAMFRIWSCLGVLVLGLLMVAAVPWISIGFLP